MTGNDLITMFNSRINYGFDALKGVDALYWLNSAQKDISEILGLEWNDVSITYPASTSFVALDSMTYPFRQINRVKIGTAELPQIDPSDNIAPQSGWYQRGNGFYLRAIPSANQTVILSGQAYARPIAATATAITDIPEHVHHTIALLAVVKAAESFILTGDAMSSAMAIRTQVFRDLDLLRRQNANSKFVLPGSNRVML